MGYFPSLILFKQDKARFNDEFNTFKYYLIPGTDLATFLLCLSHIAIMYQGADEYACFFSLTKDLDNQVDKNAGLLINQHQNHNAGRRSF